MKNKNTKHSKLNVFLSLKLRSDEISSSNKNPNHSKLRCIKLSSSNKAETREISIHTLLFIFVLVIVLGGVYLFYSNYGLPWAKNLPKFGDNSSVDGIALIRYVVLDDKVQYYDGSSWFDITKETTLDDKTISSDTTRQSFFNFYFTREFPVKLSLDNLVNKKIRNDPSLAWINGRIYKKEFLISGFSKKEKGSLFITTTHNSDNNKQNEAEDITYFKILLDNTLYDYRILTGESKLFNYIDAPETEMIEKATQWRDSVLGKPITLSYIKTGSEIPISETKTFCVEKIDNVYLNVNLNNPRESC